MSDLAKRLRDVEGHAVTVSLVDALRNEAADVLEQWTGAMHASAPVDHKCSDCTIDEEPCPTCYAAWWQKRHPNHTEIVIQSVEDKAIHITRNPHGFSDAECREARLFVCDRLESWKDAYENMCDFAEQSGLDMVCSSDRERVLDRREQK